MIYTKKYYKINLEIKKVFWTKKPTDKIKAFWETKDYKVMVKYYPLSKKVYKDGKIVNLKDFINQGFIEMTHNDFTSTKGVLGEFLYKEYTTGQIWNSYCKQ